MLIPMKQTSGGIDYKISDLVTFYAFKPPDVFDPWSESRFQKLLENISELCQGGGKGKLLKLFNNFCIYLIYI